MKTLPVSQISVNQRPIYYKSSFLYLILFLPYMWVKFSLKALSHWRRRRRDYRDWSVAATWATRETKNSLRSHQSGDVAATAPCLYIPRSTTRSIIRWGQHTLSHVITKLGQTASSSVAEKSLQRLLSLQQVSETSRRRLLSLQQVLETSRGRLLSRG